MSTQFIHGKHSVRSALKGEREIHKLLLSKTLNPHVAKEFRTLAREANIPFKELPAQHLEQLGIEGNTQGIVAEIQSYAYLPFEELLEKVKDTEAPLVLVLDQIQDPHNLGAILRTADAVGVVGVVIPKHQSAGLNETVAKTSAGAIERVSVSRVTNLARSMEQLQEAGLWLMGLSLKGEQSHFQANLTGSIGLVIGNEHKGLRPNIEKHCDLLLKIPMQSDLQSLNASVSAALGMYEVLRQKQNVKK